VHEQAMGKHALIKLSTAQTWGKPPPSPCSILYAWSHGLHPNVILSRDSQVRSTEILKIGIIAILEAYNFVCRLSINVRSEPKL